MHFKISSPGPLAGRTRVPGDVRLTLTTLAISMLSHHEITITNPSPSPDVADFLRFLERCGAVIDHSNDTITFCGNEYKDDVLIDVDVPDSIIHCIISPAVFSACSVKIVDGAGSRSHAVTLLLDLLKTVGLVDENISEDGKDIIVGSAVFSPPEVVYVDSAWAFEAVITAAAASGNPVVISYPTLAVTHILRLLTLLGFHITLPETADDKTIEISRRLSRAAGEKSQDIRTFEWSDKQGGVIKIPGDSTIAAAVCGAASLLQRSDVTVEDVIWEQGRRGFFDSLRRMKVNIEWEPGKNDHSFDSASIRVKWSKSEGIHVSSDQVFSMSSESLILGAVAAYASGKTVISNAREFPGFGRDTFTIFARGLETLGAHAGDFSEGIVLHGVQELRGDVVDPGGDSDVALALVVAALNASGTTTISGFEGDEYPAGEFLRIIKELEL